MNYEMEAYLDKMQVLEAMQSERVYLESLIAPLSDEQLCLAALDGQRSVKDVLAHIAAWERRCVGWIETGLHGETPSLPEAGYEWEDIDGLNEKTFQENLDRSLQDVLADSHQAYELLLAEVHRLSEADLTEPRRFAWTEGGTSLVPYVAANSYEHYHEHAEQIREWIEKVQPSL